MAYLEFDEGHEVYDGRSIYDPSPCEVCAEPTRTVVGLNNKIRILCPQHEKEWTNEQHPGLGDALQEGFAMWDDWLNSKEPS